MRLIDAESAMDGATLFDWYISSVVDGTPVWTEEHIDELLGDFLVIPINTPAIEAQPVKRGKWIPHGNYSVCSLCNNKSGTQYDGLEPVPRETAFCPDCGADMREEAHNVD